MVSSVVAYYTGDWRWGLRIAPLLNTAAIILMVFFCGDPPRGESDFEATEGRKSDVEVKARIRPMLIRKIQLDKVTVGLLTAFSPATAGSAFLSSHLLLPQTPQTRYCTLLPLSPPHLLI